MSVTGPTLLYLKDQVGSTISEISYIFTVRSVGTLGGAFLGRFQQSTNGKSWKLISAVYFR